MDEIGQAIAKRMLLLDGVQEIIVEIGRPFEQPERPEYYWCVYRILGLGDGLAQRVGGVDAVQALYLTLKKIGTDLYASEEGEAGRILWLGGRNLGFPVPDTISDLAPPV